MNLFSYHCSSILFINNFARKFTRNKINLLMVIFLILNKSEDTKNLNNVLLNSLRVTFSLKTIYDIRISVFTLHSRVTVKFIIFLSYLLDNISPRKNVTGTHENQSPFTFLLCLNNIV